MPKSLKYLILCLTIAGIGLGLSGFSNGGWKLSANKDPVRPMVYLVPEKHIGPVFVFFGQKDGIETTPDPLGNAVTVPKNGVIKLRGTVDSLISKDRTSRNLYWISISETGERKEMYIVNSVQRDEGGVWLHSYYDRLGVLQEAKGRNSQDVFFYLPSTARDERMIFSHGGCKNQRFGPENTPNSELPDCARFLVVSPNEFLKIPDWLWSDSQIEYDSIEALERDAHKRVLKIDQFYKQKADHTIKGD